MHYEVRAYEQRGKCERIARKVREDVDIKMKVFPDIGKKFISVGKSKWFPDIAKTFMDLVISEIIYQYWKSFPISVIIP